MGSVDCLKVSSYTKPSLRVIYTWLNSLPGAESGKNFLPSFAEWRIVPFLASSVCFYLGNSLMLLWFNTSVFSPCACCCSRDLKKFQHWSSGIFLVRIGIDLMELLCIARSPAAAGRGIWCLRWSLQGQNSYEFCCGIYNGAYVLSLHSLNWMMTTHGLKHYSSESARDFPQLVM